MNLNRKTRWLLAVTFAILASSTLALAAAGPPHGMIYAFDDLYRTVGTPTDLPPNGAFDTIYTFPDTDLISVSDAAPGHPGYNGGRWEVRMVRFVSIPPTQFTNAAQVLAAADAHEIEIGDVVKRFVCTLNRIP